MRDIRSPDLIVLKTILMLVLSLIAGGTLLAKHLDLQDGLLLLVAVWAACRFYFGAFYVIERWVDPIYRFDGLIHFGWWLVQRYMKHDKHEINKMNQKETE